MMGLPHLLMDRMIDEQLRDGPPPPEVAEVIAKAQRALQHEAVFCLRQMLEAAPGQE